MISRTRDGLLLCASMDNDNHARELEPFKKKARQLIQSCVGTENCQPTNVEDPPLYFLLVLLYFSSNIIFMKSLFSNILFSLVTINRYHIRNGVMYLALCEKAYPKKLALAFLEEISQEFEVLHGDKIQSVERPYAFIAFGELTYSTNFI